MSFLSAGNVDSNVEFNLDDIWSSLECKDSDKSFEDIIQRIEATESKVQKLNTQIHKVFSENPGKFSSLPNLDPSDPNSVSLVGAKESADQKKSISIAQVSEPDLVTKDKSPTSTSNLRRSVRRPRPKHISDA